MSIYEIEGLEELEHLQIESRKAFEIIADTMDKGPLHKYLLATRADATKAMLLFAYMDLDDSVAVRDTQLEVRKYIDVLHWTKGILENGQVAQGHIREFEGDEDV